MPGKIPVMVRHLAGRKIPEFLVTCAPERRTVLVAVRAENGPGLPVLYLGTEVARTDGSGAANVMLELPAEEQFDLTLGTPDGTKLHPRNPSETFRVPDHDDILSFNQAFLVEKRPVRRAPPPRKPTGPVNLTPQS
jgi:hypothetical protein